MVLLFYIYFGYPILLLLFSAFSKNRKQSFNAKYQPTVSLIIAAYNEEKVIEEKIKNSLAIEYPNDKLEIIVFSDSSIDSTDEIVKQYKNAGIKLFRIEGRRGKTFCQNEVVKLANGEILVFSDANSMYQTDAIKKIVRYFSNENIGCVVGELRYGNKQTGSGHNLVEGENIYWKYDKILKGLESKISSVVTGNGAIYGIRKSAYVPLEDNINSDFIEILRIVANHYRVIYEPEAVAWESTAENSQKEFRRRTRIVTGSMISIIKDKNVHPLLNPFASGIFAIQLLSHKVLRWFSGVFLILIFLLNILLLGNGIFYTLTMWGQAIFYLFAFWGFMNEQVLLKKAPKIPHVAYYFCLSCFAMLSGVMDALRGREIISWNPER